MGVRAATLEPVDETADGAGDVGARSRGGRVAAAADVDALAREFGWATVAGVWRAGGQKHFFLETNSAYATPGEDGKVEVFSSNQSLASTQSAVASALGVKEADVTLVCRRAGGGFGGKLSAQKPAAIAAAIGAALTGAPVRVHNERVDDMTMMGGRAPARAEYCAAYDAASGVVHALWLKLTFDSGCTTGAMGDASMAAQNADSAYHTAHYFCRAAIRKQPHQGNTSCRAPGNIFSIPAHELVLEHVAALIGARPEAVREANFYQPGDATPGGDVLGGAEGEHNWTVDELWARAKAAGDGWDARRAAVDAFNAANRWRKRGLCLMLSLIHI